MTMQHYNAMSCLLGQVLDKTKELAGGKKGSLMAGEREVSILNKDQGSTKGRLKGSGQRAWGQESTPGNRIPSVNARGIGELGDSDGSCEMLLEGFRQVLRW